jgi:hypothetical protein
MNFDPTLKAIQVEDVISTRVLGYYYVLREQPLQSHTRCMNVSARYVVRDD